MINITVIQGVQGSGKSLKMRNDAVVSRGLYIFACPSIELIEEQAEWLRLAFTAKSGRDGSNLGR